MRINVFGFSTTFLLIMFIISLGISFIAPIILIFSLYYEICLIENISIKSKERIK